MFRRFTIAGLLIVSAAASWVQMDQHNESGVAKDKGQPIKVPLARSEGHHDRQQGPAQLDFLEHFVEDGLQADQI